MKKIFVYLSAVISIAILGCKEDFTLDLESISSSTDRNYWKTPEQWNAMMNGVHHNLRTDQMDFLTLGEFRSDIWGVTPFTGSTVLGMRIHDNTINEDSPGISEFGGFYSNINQINLIIYKTLDTNVLSEENKNFYLGQAYGMRAFYYFHLLRSWGNVVIQEEPSFDFKLNELAKAASPASDVMSFIKADIEKSLIHFGNNYSFNTKIKWSKAATLMLKGNVYLWSARQMNGGTEDARIAKEALADIQTNIPSLKLLENFRDVFSSDNKQNDEIIFALHNEQDEYQFDWNSFVARDLFVIKEPYRDSLTGQPYNLDEHNVITAGGGLFYAIYNKIYNGYSDVDSRRYVSLQAAYEYENGEYTQAVGVWENKFQGSFYLGLRIWTDDYPIYRYADLLLMLAEAKSLLSEDPTIEINLVRQRAFGENYQLDVYGYPNQPIDNDINEALLKERLNEFVIEGKRWYDLRRFGTEYVTKYTSADPQRLLWPIDLITLTNNSALEQTEGY